MSQGKERREKNCLNCNAQLQGRYCQICGQENTEPKETFWHLINHFFQDITHFDGKFFSTLKLLILRPGFLSREYMAGRRASYLNPIRMYLFTSAFFFLIFFTFFTADTYVNIKPPTVNEKVGDSISTPPPIRISKLQYGSKAEYDSVLVSGVNHSWLRKLITYKIIALSKKYNNDNDRLMAALLNSLLHSIPQMLFVSLPLLALLLKLLYFRRKNFYYVDHGIFSIHFYIFVFIAMLIVFGLSELNAHLRWGLITYLIAVINVFLFIYEYKAMRNFYQQRRGKTFVKLFLLNLLFFIVLILLFTVFFFLSIFKI